MKVSNKYRLCVIYNSWWSWERLFRNNWCWNNGDQNNFRHAFCEFFCVVFTPRWKDSLIFVLVFSYFSSVKCFLLCDLSKNFIVHCNAFEKSLGHLTLPHGKITWFETIDTSTKMFVIPTPWRLHKIVTDVLCLTSSCASIGEKWFCIFC